MKHTILFSLTLFLLIACSETIQSTNDQPVIKKVKTTSVISNKKSININGHKFILLDNKLEKGNKVFNLLTKEKGAIKGSIVVVTNNVMKLSKTVTKIAENTFMKTPDKGQSLQQLYNQLKSDPQYKTVELQIDYSPISTAPTM